MFFRLVLPAGSPGWFSRLVLPAGSPGWFSRLVLPAGSPGWFSWLLLPAGSLTRFSRFSRLVLPAGSLGWFSRLVLPAGSPGWFSRLVLPGRFSRSEAYIYVWRRARPGWSLYNNSPAGCPGWFSRLVLPIGSLYLDLETGPVGLEPVYYFSRPVLPAGSHSWFPGWFSRSGAYFWIWNGPGWAGNNVIPIENIEKSLLHSLQADGPKTYHALLLEFCLRQIMSPLRASLSLALRKCLCFTCPCNWFHNHGEIVEACRV